ncbi:helix-turn-helix domain-containing protein [Streptomyces sp. NPDC060209]|uniref:helix-turn-helix domain-containing protein n=1 Tax=Streptomyces sp. NPDC060209 TaxID=3347073 RepID=UPI00365A6BCD
MTTAPLGEKASRLETQVGETSENELLNAVQVAQILRLHPQTVRRLVREGRLSAHRLGSGSARRRGLRIRRASVDKYLTESAVS